MLFQEDTPCPILQAPSIGKPAEPGLTSQGYFKYFDIDSLDETSDPGVCTFRQEDRQFRGWRLMCGRLHR